MPKMDATPAVPPGGDILSRITPLPATNLGRMKVSLYGEAKTGKTRLACTFPKPLLLIGGDNNGTASVLGTPGVDFLQLTLGDICGDFMRVIDAVRGGLPSRSKKPYATVVCDTASSIRDIRIAEILQWKAVPEQMGFRYASQEQWGECSQNLKDMLRPMLDLPKWLNVNIVVIAHEATFIPSEKLAKGGEHLQIHVGSALGESTCRWLNKEVDYIAQCLIRDKVDTLTQVNPADGSTATVQVPTGKKEYALRVGPHSTYYTGFRLPNGRVLTDEFLVNPTYDILAALIAGK